MLAHPTNSDAVLNFKWLIGRGDGRSAWYVTVCKKVKDNNSRRIFNRIEVHIIVRQ